MNENAENNGAIEIDILQMVFAVWHRAWAVVLSMLVCGVVAFTIATFFITPMYKADVLIYVNNSSVSLGSTNVSISASELTAAQSLVDTYIVILETRTTLNEVIERARLNIPYDKLKGMLSAGAVNNTEVFSITVTSDDPAQSELIANVISEVLPTKIADIVDGSSVRIVDSAVIPTKKSSPNVTRITAIGLILGALLAVGVIVLMELMDSYVRSEDYIVQTYKIPLLAVIPDMNDSGTKGSQYYTRYAASTPKRPSSERRA